MTGVQTCALPICQPLYRTVPIEQELLVPLELGAEGLELDFELDVLAEGEVDLVRCEALETLFVEVDLELEVEVLLVEDVDDLRF